MVDEGGAQLPLLGGGLPPGAGAGAGAGGEVQADCWSQLVATHPVLPWYWTFSQS